MRQIVSGQSGLDDSVGTDAGSADLDGLDGAIVIDFDSLQVRAEGALRVLHDVHTDTALLLGKTPAGNVPTNCLVLAANLTNSAHFDTSNDMAVFFCMVFKKQPVLARVSHGAIGGTAGTRTRDPRIKSAMLLPTELPSRPFFKKDKS